ncbi:MAG: hypothetical protein RL490_1039 [Pseudomonadota bacterium]
MLIVQVVLAANLAHIRLDDPSGAGLGVDDGRRRPISLLSIATSMGVPHETIRRQAHELQRRGAILKIGSGWIVPSKLLTETLGIALIAADAAALVALVDDLARLGAASAQAIDPHALRALPPDLLARLWNDFIVLAVEPAGDICGSVLDFGLFMAIIRMNVEHITADAERTRRHAALDAIPDDRDRRPAGLRALARAEQLPYPTVRRRVAALVARGVAEDVDGGVIIPARVLGNEAMARSNLLNVQRVEKLFSDLKRLGDGVAGPRGETSIARREDQRLSNPRLQPPP